ncbi:MAG: homoserine kinase [Gemmatimonadetes bacterium]|nr:homoserine kinase [Gemmatimonadota bacterium]
MSPEEGCTAFAPATVGNVICGFDIFGLALEAPGDRVTAWPSSRPGVRIREIAGDGGRLPKNPDRNSATVAIRALLLSTGRHDGIEVSILKGLPLSGGMGGSAASAVAGVIAADALLGTKAPLEVLLQCSVEGEATASGGAHLDNVAPALYGGLVLVRPGRSRPVVRLPIPQELHVSLLHPEVEVSTREARRVLGTSVPLAEAVAQWGSTAAFVHALHSGDWDLLQDSLQDRIAEPRRAHLIPGFEAVRQAALDAGALACGISGAGPSMLSLCRGAERARAVGEAMASAFHQSVKFEASLHLSPVAERGARVEASSAETSG